MTTTQRKRKGNETMKLSVNSKLSGSYSNGISTWEFTGTITEIHNDTAGGNFATGRIELDADSRFDNRNGIMITLDAKHHVADSRYNLN